MTTYNTGNPLGSVAAKDLYDNTENFDDALNDVSKDTWTDRFGRDRKTYRALERLADPGTAIAAAERAEEARDQAELFSGAVHYFTLAGLQVDASPAGTVGVVMDDPNPDNNGYYLTDGTTWSRTDFQPLGTRSALPYNGLIPNASSLNGVLAQGVYRGNANGGYLDLPPDFPVTSAFTLTNVNQSTLAESSRFVLQTLRQFTTPWNTWARLVDQNSIGLYPWEREATATYRGTTSADLNTLTQPGHWIYTGSPPNLPPGAPASGFVENTPYGSYYLQEVRDLANPLIVWARINRTSPVTIGAWADPISRYRGTLGASDDLNALPARNADYVLTASPANAPPNGPTGGTYSTRVTGDWEEEVLKATLDPAQEWRRRRRVSTNQFESWGKVGSPLKGRYIFIGDSITEFGDYPERIGNKLGISVLKAGFGGCRMGKHTQALYDPMCMYRIAECINTDDFTPLIQGAEDLFTATGDDNRPQALALSQENYGAAAGIVIAFGTNDFGGDRPIGTNSDSTGDTFKGSINLVVDKILSKYPRLNIFFVAPMWRARFNSGDGKDADIYPNGIGTFLIEYTDAVLEVAALNKVPAVDLYRNSGINKFNHATFLGTDGLHPVAGVGYQRLADRIAAGMAANM